MIKKSQNIVVVGDSMLDAYVIAEILGVSPEAPVPLCRQLNEENRLGGAANVAMNLNSMGARPHLISVSGDDLHGKILLDLLKTKGIKADIIKDSKRPTSLKTRLVDTSYKQQFRWDRESTQPVSPAIEKKLLDILDKSITKRKSDAVIIQDYNKGVLTKNLIKAIQKKCQQNKIPLLVDPKHDHFELLSDCDIFKPNLKECRSYLKETGLRSDSVCKKISEQLKASKSMVITLGDKGLFYKDQDSRGKIPAYKLKAADVSGAGDTVIAALAISMLEGQDLRTMAEFANKAGALSCSKDGVSSVSVKEIRRFKANK